MPGGGGGWPGVRPVQGGEQPGDRGACLPQQQPAIKRSQCQCEPEPKPHSSAAPSGRMKRGFHGYHAKEENIWIKPESKVCPVSFVLNTLSRQGSREGGEAGAEAAEGLSRRAPQLLPPLSPRQGGQGSHPGDHSGRPEL